MQERGLVIFNWLLLMMMCCLYVSSSRCLIVPPILTCTSSFMLTCLKNSVMSTAAMSLFSAATIADMSSTASRHSGRAYVLFHHEITLLSNISASSAIDQPSSFSSKNMRNGSTCWRYSQAREGGLTGTMNFWLWGCLSSCNTNFHTIKAKSFYFFFFFF